MVLSFQSNASQKWSKEVFEISKVDTSAYPYMYDLKDLKDEPIIGKFYEYELQQTELKDFAVVEKVLKTKTVKGKKMYLVKYDGYDDKFNEWLNQNQLDKIT